MKILDWLDDRTGYRGITRSALTEPILGGASMAFVFGSVLLFLLILQMTTGVLLAFVYSPSSTDAWASVAYIQDVATGGWLIRGLHHHGASAMVIVAGLHMLQTALYGAYKKPRELNWITGVLLLGLILAFALTGYLLPWDQTGYWATKVATGIAGGTPVLGVQVQEAMQGGNEYGNLTLTRFYALHVFVLPALTIGLVAVHLVLFRRHGVTPSWRPSAEQLRQRVQPFWPDQLFRDVLAMAIAFALLFGFVTMEGGARLDAPADPSSNFDARPEWYFRALFQLLKYFEGPMEMIAALGVPAIVGAVLIGLPFLDRGPSHCPLRRKLPLGILGIGAVAAGALTVLSFQSDASDAELQKRIAASEQQAKLARRLAREHGVPSAGGTAVYETAPFAKARGLWARECAGCHEGEERSAPIVGPGYNDRAWIRGFLKDPRGDAYFAHTKLGDKDAGMDPVEVSDKELDALVEMVYAESQAPDANAALAAEGRAFFNGEDAGCRDCHARVGDESAAPEPAPVPPMPPPDAGAGAAEEGEQDGGVDAEEPEEPEEEEAPTAPNLNGRGSPEYLIGFFREPGSPRYFGEHNEMDPFLDELGPVELRALVEWVTWLRTATPEDVEALDSP